MSGEWDKLALIHVLLGYEADVLGIISFLQGDKNTQSLLIVGFLLYTVGGVLLVLSKAAGLLLDFIISVIVIIILFIAAILIVVGVGWYNTYNNLNPYSATLEVSSAALAILAAIFLILKISRGASRTTPS